jgi:hypothetical protein
MQWLKLSIRWDRIVITNKQMELAEGGEWFIQIWPAKAKDSQL